MDTQYFLARIEVGVANLYSKPEKPLFVQKVLSDVWIENNSRIKQDFLDTQYFLARIEVGVANLYSDSEKPLFLLEVLSVCLD